MARTSPVRFPPNGSPEGRIVEMHVLDELRRVFELHGFAGIETRAVETLAQLEAKGETSKEIYVLDRLQALKAAASGARAPRTRAWVCTSTSPCPSRVTSWRTRTSWTFHSSATRFRRSGVGASPGGAFP